MKLRQAAELRQEPRWGLSREGTTVMHEMHLIVVVMIVGDAAPRSAGKLELVIENGVEPDDSGIEFRRHSNLREEASLELPR